MHSLTEEQYSYIEQLANQALSMSYCDKAEQIITQIDNLSYQYLGAIRDLIGRIVTTLKQYYTVQTLEEKEKQAYFIHCDLSSLQFKVINSK